MNTIINNISKQLCLITLCPPIPGFDNFIGTWLYKGQPSFLVDVGPSATAGFLLKTLKELKVNKPDYIFLTHIHMDHAGGIGEIAEAFPETPIVCHKSAIAHLVEPSRLWKGTVKTLGDIGRAYGRMKPVPSDRLVDAQIFVSDSVIPVITPGHASHHVSYQFKDYLFAGEAGGVFYELSSKPEYLRPATPPPFFLETFVKSIEALIAQKPVRMCYGHFGITNNAIKMLLKHRDQLLFWEKIIDDEIKHSTDADFLNNCMNRLLTEDPCLKGFFYMDEAVKDRERYFLKNSIKGFEGYLKNRNR